ncbi:MAG TPA: hypothetical protein VM598_01395 [Bdellovibrionota bacterium]|nr:hypothetical protein [Bdellovibrionota bacterium]
MTKSQKVVCVLLTDAPRNFDPVAWAEALGRFSPQVALRASEAVFLEMSKSHHLFGPGLPRRVQALALRFGIDPSRLRIGEGPDAGMALIRARYPKHDALRTLPLEALIDFGSPFRFDFDLQKKTLDLIKVLRELGVRNLGGFLELPSESLASRFGQEISELAGRLVASVDGRLSLPWPGFHPKPLVTEKVDLTDVETRNAVSALDAMSEVLGGLLDRSIARLRGRSERASAVQVEMELENWSTVKNTRRKWKVVLPLPLGSATSLLAILNETLSFSLDREPLEAPVQSVHFSVLETVPGYGSQRDFFDRKEEDAEAWDSLVGRLSHRLGKGRVFVARPVERYLPEGAWARKLELERGLLSGLRLGEVLTRNQTQGNLALQPEPVWPERPARLLEEPVPLQRVGAILRDPKSGRRWRIAEWDGPERLSGEWWKSDSLDGFHRDYYQVKAETGERLWVFVCRSPEREAPSQAYLHGYFD